MRTLRSRPGSDAYWDFSLTASQLVGGLFQPGTAVDPLAVDSCCDGFIPWAGLSDTFPVGAVVGAGDCASAAVAKGSARAAPRINAPSRRAWLRTMVCSSRLFFGVAGAQVLVLRVGALRQDLLVLLLVALE